VHGGLIQLLSHTDTDIKVGLLFLTHLIFNFHADAAQLTNVCIIIIVIIILPLL